MASFDITNKRRDELFAFPYQWVYKFIKRARIKLGFYTQHEAKNIFHVNKIYGDMRKYIFYFIYYQTEKGKPNYVILHVFENLFAVNIRTNARARASVCCLLSSREITSTLTSDFRVFFDH